MQTEECPRGCRATVVRGLVSDDPFCSRCYRKLKRIPMVIPGSSALLALRWVEKEGARYTSLVPVEQSGELERVL